MMVVGGDNLADNQESSMEIYNRFIRIYGDDDDDDNGITMMSMSKTFIFHQKMSISI